MLFANIHVSCFVNTLYWVCLYIWCDLISLKALQASNWINNIRKDTFRYINVFFFYGQFSSWTKWHDKWKNAFIPFFAVVNILCLRSIYTMNETWKKKCCAKKNALKVISAAWKIQTSAKKLTYYKKYFPVISCFHVISCEKYRKWVQILDIKTSEYGWKNDNKLSSALHTTFYEC